MKKLHAQAAEEIFRKRNKNPINKKHPILDLHGLHPKEGLDILMRELEKLYETCYFVDVLVGTGHHSQKSHFRETWVDMVIAPPNWSK